MACGLRTASLVTSTDQFQKREKGQLIMGSEGISWVLDAEHRRTVRWDDVAACFSWDDGKRQLLGSDGIVVSVVPWSWQGGERLTDRIDANVDRHCHIRRGEGSRLYQADTDDETTVAEVHWLGTIVGALHRRGRERDRVDLVIDTDGIFMLHGVTTQDSLSQHHQQLRTADRHSLLARDLRNRWVEEAAIERVQLSTKAFDRFKGLKATLTVDVKDEASLIVDLRTDKQLEVSRLFEDIVGQRFEESR